MLAWVLNNEKNKIHKKKEQDLGHFFMITIGSTWMISPIFKMNMKDSELLADKKMIGNMYLCMAIPMMAGNLLSLINACRSRKSDREFSWFYQVKKRIVSSLFFCRSAMNMDTGEWVSPATQVEALIFDVSLFALGVLMMKYMPMGMSEEITPTAWVNMTGKMLVAMFIANSIKAGVSTLKSCYRRYFEQTGLFFLAHRVLL